MDRNISRTFSGRQTPRNYNEEGTAKEIQPRRYKYFEISCRNVRGAPGDKRGSQELQGTHRERE